MPIPANQITHAEIIMYGAATAQGSNTKNFQFVFHMRRTSTTNPVSKSGLESVFQSAIAVDIVAALNNTYAQRFNTVRWLNDALDAPLQVTRVVAGSVTGDAMAKHNSVYVLMRTGLRGKNYRGSKHFGPLSESDTTAGSADILNSGALTNWGTAVTSMLAGISDASGNLWVMSVFARKLSQSRVNPTTIVANDVTAILINKRIGRMRRREVVSVY